MAKDHGRSWKDLLGGGTPAHQRRAPEPVCRPSRGSAGYGVTMSPESWCVPESPPPWLVRCLADDWSDVCSEQDRDWSFLRRESDVQFYGNGSVKRISLPSMRLSFCPRLVASCGSLDGRLLHVQRVGVSVCGTLPLLLVAACMVCGSRGSACSLSVGASACDDKPRGGARGSVFVSSVGILGTYDSYDIFGATHLMKGWWSSSGQWLTRSFAEHESQKLRTLWGFVATSLRLLVSARSMLLRHRSLCGAFGTGVPASHEVLPRFCRALPDRRLGGVL